jgi:hypothetical protein
MLLLLLLGVGEVVRVLQVVLGSTGLRPTLLLLLLLVVLTKLRGLLGQALWGWASSDWVAV